MTEQDIQFHQNLLPPDPTWGARGVIRPPEDPRDYLAVWHRGIRAALRVGVPANSDMILFVKEPRYDQGNEGSCTCFATSANCTMDHSEADGSWPQYAGHQLYAEAGGSGNSGADPRQVLQICVDRGMPTLSGGREKVLKSYVALDRTPGTFRAQVKAAIVSGSPALIYCLLPIPFGWNSGMTLSSAYHEWLAIGYQTDSQGREWCIVLNSWSDSWPGDQPAGVPGGIGRILFDALEQNNGQNGYLGGFVASSLLITPPVPNPTPDPAPPVPTPTSRTLSGTISGAGVSTLAAGQDCNVSSASFTGNLHVTQISGLDPDPLPIPDPTPKPGPTPVPGALKVILATRKVGGTGVVWAQATDASGAYVAGTAQGTAGSVALEQKACSQTPAVWQKPGASGAVSVTVTAGSQSGQGSGVL